jgi:aldose 1-epimerase
MGRITLDTGRRRCEIDPDLGAAVTDFSVAGPGGHWFPLLRRAAAAEHKPGAAASFLMAPWTNRIAGAAFAFGGRTHRLRANNADRTAIHGDVRSRAWTILDRSPLSARLTLNAAAWPDMNFPFPFTATIRYELSDGGLSTELSITNTGTAPMPAGCGFHPYFMRTLWDAGDAVELRCRCAGRYPAAQQLPTGPANADAITARLSTGGALADLELDDVFGGWNGHAQVRWPGSGVTARLECSAELGHLVIYTPRSTVGAKGPMPWFAVEPVSMVNDGFNLMARGMEGTGVAVLETGGSLSVRFWLRVEVDE